MTKKTETPTSKYSNISFHVAMKKWRLSFQTVLPDVEYYDTEEAAADRLLELVRGIDIIPGKLRAHMREEGTGRFLRQTRDVSSHDNAEENQISRFHGVVHIKKKRVNNWRLGCEPFVPRRAFRYFDSQEEAADELKKLVDEHLKSGAFLPKGMLHCTRDEEGRFLQAVTGEFAREMRKDKKAIRAIAHQLNPEDEPRFYGVTYAPDATNPWLLRLNNRAIQINQTFMTQEEAADHLKMRIADYLAENQGQLPPLFDDCEKDAEGRYLKLGKNRTLDEASPASDDEQEEPARKSHFVCVSYDRGRPKVRRWVLKLQNPELPRVTKVFKTAEHAADELKKMILEYQEEHGGQLPPPFGKYPKDEEGRYLKRFALESEAAAGPARDDQRDALTCIPRYVCITYDKRRHATRPWYLHIQNKAISAVPLKMSFKSQETAAETLKEMIERYKEEHEGQLPQPFDTYATDKEGRYLKPGLKEMMEVASEAWTEQPVADDETDAIVHSSTEGPSVAETLGQFGIFSLPQALQGRAPTAAELLIDEELRRLLTGEYNLVSAEPSFP